MLPFLSWCDRNRSQASTLPRLSRDRVGIGKGRGKEEIVLDGTRYICRKHRATGVPNAIGEIWQERLTMRRKEHGR